METVSFYQIAKELAEEDGVTGEEIDPKTQKVMALPLVVDGVIKNRVQFDTYRKKRQEYLEELLGKAHILKKFKPNHSREFQIPIGKKEDIKFLVRQYASPVSRKIRKRKTDTITTADAKNEFESILKFIHLHMPEGIQTKEISTALAFSELTSRIAFDEVETALLKLIETDLCQVKWRPVSNIGAKTRVSKRGQVLDKRLRISNDSDAAFLIYLYLKMLRQQSLLWNEIVDEVADLRNEEIYEAIGPDENESASNGIFRDIRETIQEAQSNIFMRKLEASRAEPTSEQMKVVEDFINKR